MTKMLSSTYKIGDIVVVSFPFADSDQTKNRPALIISDEWEFNRSAGHTILAMITSSFHASWPLDVHILDLEVCGLLKPSLIRFKVFTLDNRLIKQKIGQLSLKEQEKFRKNLRIVFSLP